MFIKSNIVKKKLWGTTAILNQHLSIPILSQYEKKYFFYLLLYFFSSLYIVQSFPDLHHCSDTDCCLMWGGKKLGRQVFCRCRGIDPSDPVFVLCHSFVFPNVSVLYLCWPRWPCIGIRIHLLPLLFLRVFFAPGLLPAVVTPLPCFIARRLKSKWPNGTPASSGPSAKWFCWKDQGAGREATCLCAILSLEGRMSICIPVELFAV